MTRTDLVAVGSKATKDSFETAGKAAKFLVQITLVVAIYYLGVGLSSILPVSVPGNIIGMMLLLVLLVTGLLKEKYVKHACSFLLKYMAVFILPAGVAVLQSLGILQGDLLEFSLVCILTTVLVFITTSATVVAVSRIMSKHQKQN